MTSTGVGLGLDFGTTNSSIARARAGEESELALFRLDGRSTSTFRSVLYFDPEESGRARKPAASAGPAAIEAYRDAGAGAGGRFIQSLKSFLASRLFEATRVFGWKFTLEDLIAAILRELRVAAETQLGAVDETVLIGRPVHFVVEATGETDTERDDYALARLATAAERAGFARVRFEYEPVAAAHHYERGLDHDELVLIGDFGGGTSDFCLIRLGPSARRAADRGGTILGVDGVPLAGNAFDARIVHSVVAPGLGLGSRYRSERGQELPIPAWLYARLERWEDVSVLATPATLEVLSQLHRNAIEPDRIEGLIHLVRDDLGYALYREVEATKLALSDRTTTRFSFDALPTPIAAMVERTDFERWIGPHLVRIAASIDGLLERCNVPSSAVDRVFLTGGSSLVPSVREVFARRFGAERLRGGEELTTVARGLASIAAAGDGAA